MARSRSKGKQSATRCKCAYELVEFDLSFPPIGSLEDIFSSNDAQFYPPGTKPASFSPPSNFEFGQGIKGEHITFYTNDGELSMDLSVRPNDEKGFIETSGGFPTVKNVQSFGIADPSISSARHSVNTNILGCSVIKHFYIAATDLDAQEYFDTVGITENFTVIPATGGQPSNFNLIGTRYQSVGQNNILILRFDGLPQELVSQYYEHGRDVFANNGSNVFFGADYYRPVKRCGNKWRDRYGNVVSTVFRPKDLVAEGLLADGSLCCSSMTPEPTWVLHDPLNGKSVDELTIYSQEYFSKSSDGLVEIATGSRNLQMVRTNVGRWTITLTTPHPDGAIYHPIFSVEEQSNLLDTPFITVVQGSITSTSFDIQITADVNTGTTDAYVDTPFMISINSPTQVASLT